MYLANLHDGQLIGEARKCLGYSHEIDDGKRHVMLVTDRPIGMREASSLSRSLDYDTTVISMEFPVDNKDADGTGLLYMALKIRYDDKEKKLKVEEWGQQPTRLTKITRDK